MSIYGGKVKFALHTLLAYMVLIEVLLSGADQFIPATGLFYDVISGTKRYEGFYTVKLSKNITSVYMYLQI